MLVPGSNLLNMALRVINPQGLIWQRWISRTANPNGTFVNAYAPKKKIIGSAQGIDKKLYQMLGLDMSKDYIVVYTSAPLQTVKRNTAGDLMAYNNKQYKVESEQDWTGPDGWAAYTCIQVDAA